LTKQRAALSIFFKKRFCALAVRQFAEIFIFHQESARVLLRASQILMNIVTIFKSIMQNNKTCYDQG
jgi:hypothetical protein